MTIPATPAADPRLTDEVLDRAAAAVKHEGWYGEHFGPTGHLHLTDEDASVLARAALAHLAPARDAGTIVYTCKRGRALCAGVFEPGPDCLFCERQLTLPAPSAPPAEQPVQAGADEGWRDVMRDLLGALDDIRFNKFGERQEKVVRRAERLLAAVEVFAAAPSPPAAPSGALPLLTPVEVVGLKHRFPSAVVTSYHRLTDDLSAVDTDQLGYVLQNADAVLHVYPERFVRKRDLTSPPVAPSGVVEAFADDWDRRADAFDAACLEAGAGATLKGESAAIRRCAAELRAFVATMELAP